MNIIRGASCEDRIYTLPAVIIKEIQIHSDLWKISCWREINKLTLTLLAINNAKHRVNK